MLFILAMLFVLVYTTNQIVGFGLAAVLTCLAPLDRGLSGAWVRFNRKDVLYAAYAVVAIVPTLRFGDAYEATFYLRIVVYPWLVSFVFQNVNLSYARLKIWSLLVLLVAFATVALMLFQEAPGQFSISLDRLLTLDRSRGFYYRGDERIGPNAAAAMCSAAIAVGLALHKFRRIGVLAGAALLAVFVPLLMIAGGRNAWLSVILLLGLYGVTGFGQSVARGMSQRITTVAIVGFVGLLAVVMYEGLLSAHGSAFQERVAGIANPLEDLSVRQRFYYWAVAVAMIQNQPWGLGFNAYYALYERTPHNEILGQWIGAGWIGAVFYLVLVGYLFVRSFAIVRRGLRNTDEGFSHYLLLSLLTVAGLAMLTEHISRGGMNTFYPLVWMAVGFSYAAAGGHGAGRQGSSYMRAPTRESRQEAERAQLTEGRPPPHLGAC